VNKKEEIKQLKKDLSICRTELTILRETYNPMMEKYYERGERMEILDSFINRARLTNIELNLIDSFFNNDGGAIF